MKKTLILAAALATLVGAPAFAQSYDPELGTANTAPVWNSNAQEGTSAFAQALPGVDPSPARSVRATGIFENLPAGVNPYAYHENLEASQAN